MLHLFIETVKVKPVYKDSPREPALDSFTLGILNKKVSRDLTKHRAIRKAQTIKFLKTHIYCIFKTSSQA